MHSVVPPARVAVVNPLFPQTPVIFSFHHVPPQHSRYPRLTNTVLSSAFAQHHLDNTDTISLTIKVNPSRAVTFTVEILTSHYCPPGSQLILGRDVQAACIQSSEPDLPNPRQQSSSQLSATAIRENPGAAENFLSYANDIENSVTFGTTLPPTQSPPLIHQLLLPLNQTPALRRTF
ncbi:hypothetical protein K435DRAFT_861235 [Dendrothele bispora CBS 962.96]|uniref:Uncharacterized protein n=1 Tax=Dendrothele bispora (strain CBS 962.96) TaxID=1314807 RepID=A0A4S8LX56_DENBC|nr:hypothetical protein K435DRAFT_861235 [Dendrothele bispora CBS 962.96]